MADPRDQFQDQVIALRRSQILDAATRVFAERGFHRTTVRDIAKAAGVADGTIYNYFENKTALLLGILNRLNETERRERDIAQLTTADDLHSTMGAYMQQRLALLGQDDLAAMRALLPEVLADPQLRELYNRQIIEPTYALAEPLIAQLIAQGRFRQLDPALLLRVISGMVLGLLVLRMIGDTQVKEHYDRLPELLTTILLDGLLPERAD